MSAGCPDVDTLLSRAGDRSAIEAHAAGCDACGSLLALRDLRREPGAAGATPACADASGPLAAMAEGRLTDGERERLAAHLSICSVCRETAARLALLGDDLDDVPEPRRAEPAQPPASVVSLGGERLRRRGYGLVHLAIAAAIGAIVAASVLRAARGPREGDEARFPPEPASSADAERARLAEERARVEADRARLAEERAAIEAERQRLAERQRELEALAAASANPPPPDTAAPRPSPTRSHVGPGKNNIAPSIDALEGP